MAANTAMFSLPNASSSHRESPPVVQRAIEYAGPEHQHLPPPQSVDIPPSETASSCVCAAIDLYIKLAVIIITP